MLTKLIALFVVNVGELLVEVLGDLKDIVVINPPYGSKDKEKPIRVLVGRVIKLGPNYTKDPSFENVGEDDLVLFASSSGYELRQDGKRFRRFDRTDIIAALLKEELELEHISPEDLIVIEEPGQAVAASAAEPPPPPQIEIEFINGRGLGFAHRIQVNEGITLSGLLEGRGIDPENRVLTVLRNGEELPPTADLVIEEGDHVEALPVQVTGFAGNGDSTEAEDDEDEDDKDESED